MKWRAMLRDWRGFLACFRLRCPKCGRYYDVPSEDATGLARLCACNKDEGRGGA
jgi:hypothetical protein